MPIVAAFMVPHPPMIVPEVGRGSEKQVEKTIKAYERVADEIAALKPETIIISSPHSIMYSDYFHISPGSGAVGSFAEFGAPQVKFDVSYDEELVKKICGMADAACFPGSSGSPVLICNVGGYRDKQGNLNWGSSRIFLLGILYAGPQLTVTGEIKVVNIPNMQQKQLAISHIPNNLGYVIKSERIMDFAPILKRS